MAAKREVHGFIVSAEDDARRGVEFLANDLEYSELKVFANQARARGTADFQDSQRRNFTLRYNGDGTYTVVTRRARGGFFSGWF